MNPTDLVTAGQLRNRILEQIPKHPEIMGFHSAVSLHQIKGLNVDDLDPSMGQAEWALRAAQERYKRRTDRPVRDQAAVSFARTVAGELAKHNSAWRADFFATLQFCPSCGDAVEETCYCKFSKLADEY